MSVSGPRTTAHLSIVGRNSLADWRTSEADQVGCIGIELLIGRSGDSELLLRRLERVLPISLGSTGDAEAYPLLRLLPGPLHHEPDGMLCLLVVKVGMSTALPEAAAVKALQTNENALGVILRLSAVYELRAGFLS